MTHLPKNCLKLGKLEMLFPLSILQAEAKKIDLEANRHDHIA